MVDVHFDFNKGELLEQAQTQLPSHAETLKSGTWDLLIQGHTDRHGSVGFNLRVEKRRPEVVKDYLATFEVPKARMHVVSLGEFEPTCQEDTEACANTNRQVTFSLVKRDSKIVQLDNRAGETEEQEINPVGTQNATDNMEKEEKSPS